MSARKVVLVIDDEHGIRLTLSMIFQGSGYSVLVAADGREGLGLFNSNAVDVVLLDYHLPGEKGFDGPDIGSDMKRIKPRVPIAVLSGDTNAGSSTSFADLLLPKPIEPPELLRRIAELLNSPQDSTTKGKQMVKVDRSIRSNAFTPQRPMEEAKERTAVPPNVPIKPPPRMALDNHASFQDKIRSRAHEIYVQRGAKQGSAEQDWIQAEAEILGHI